MGNSEQVAGSKGRGESYYLNFAIC